MKETSPNIKQIFKEKFPTIGEDALDALVGICKFKVFKNKEILIKAGSTTRDFAYIVSGVVRGYYINNEGVEKNIFLRSKDSFVGSPDILIDRTHTKYTYESILQCDLILLNLDEFEKICKNHPSLYEIYLWGLKYTLVTMIYRVEAMIDKQPEERYEDLLKRSPVFFQKAFNKHIANYLGITPVSLSRIIKRRKNAPNT